MKVLPYLLTCLGTLCLVFGWFRVEKPVSGTVCDREGLGPELVRGC
jgi:hypothetical protein